MITNQDITWAKFEENNPNVTEAFEDMCGMLFQHSFCENNDIIHANHNNPGVEIEPILQKDTKKRISYQAKYFTSLSYPQIQHSAEMAVKYYNGQLDVIYLYCNKDLTTTSKQYQKIEKILDDVGIQLVPISNRTIINLVFEYPVIANAFFKIPSLDNTWFSSQVTGSLASLGVRYNEKFNVETETDKYVDLFLHSVRAVELINNRKKETLISIKRYQGYDNPYNKYVDKVLSLVYKIDDVNQYNILECLNWESDLQSLLKEERLLLEKEKDKKANLQHSDFEKEEDYYKNIREVNMLDELINFPILLRFDEEERSLLLQNMMIISGDAGVGKSQVFANAVQRCVNEKQAAILLLGGMFLTSDVVSDQILSVLGIEFDFDTLLSVLERKAVVDNQFAILFIDAINESGVKDIWKEGVYQLYQKIQKYPHVKIGITYRNGYEKILLNDAVNDLIEKDEIVRIEHHGFQQESVEATKQFLNNYGIPFSPSYILQYEMTNPLFLTLFCKTYLPEANDFDMFTVFEKIIQQADSETQKVLGFDGSELILMELLRAIVSDNLSRGERHISGEKLRKLSFWNEYGISTKKIPYISALVKVGIFTTYALGGAEEYYDFGYDLMRDFISAKIILVQHESKQSIRDYIQNGLLKIVDGNITQNGNNTIFVIICGLYAEKYHEECIDIIDKIENKYDFQGLISDYMRCFSWRKGSSIRIEDFRAFVNTHPVTNEDFFKTIIENSSKPNHPLNAKWLHSILFPMDLSKRDNIWTIYINDLDSEDERIFQLITLFCEADNLEDIPEETVMLMLILFSWLLSSSNRYLRDQTSHAMINILKLHFDKAVELLNLFEGVNDPYVCERLYGVMFGACIKRKHDFRQEFKTLAEYIYDVIFNAEQVYPNILLRDYARLIIERWNYEYPEDMDGLDMELIKPPYNLEDIPIVEKQEYKSEEGMYGLSSIARSMYPDSMPGRSAMYGDFGRYIFEDALKNFKDVNIENAYHFAMQYIRDELGYSDQLFGEYDSNGRGWNNRYETKKNERIGKKYQWITLYYVLARIADTNMIQKYSWMENPVSYNGACDIRVRNFEPTLGKYLEINSFYKNFKINLTKMSVFTEEYNEDSAQEWVKDRGNYLEFQEENIIVTDEDGVEWVCIYKYESISNELHKQNNKLLFDTNGAQQIYFEEIAYIVHKSEYNAFRDWCSDKNLREIRVPSRTSSTQIFNGEIPWSSSSKYYFDEQWEAINDIIEHKVQRKSKMPLFEDFYVDEFNFEKVINERVESDEVTISHVMPATINVGWENEYDASKEEPEYHSMPCPSMITHMNLHQGEQNGEFYSEKGEMIAFEEKDENEYNSVYIRLDELKKYLSKMNYRICWICCAEKHYYYGTQRNGQEWTDWRGFFELEDCKTVGCIKMI